MPSFLVPVGSCRTPVATDTSPAGGTHSFLLHGCLVHAAPAAWLRQPCRKDWGSRGSGLGRWEPIGTIGGRWDGWGSEKWGFAARGARGGRRGTRDEGRGRASGRAARSKERRLRGLRSGGGGGG